MGALRTDDGRTLSYRELGSGPVVICHPGGPGFSSLYLQDLAGLGAQFSLILLDPRGTGASDRPADLRAYAVDDYAADVEALRIHLGLEQIDLLGHSHGGFVAMANAIARPARVRRLVLASTLARFSPEQAQEMQTMMQTHSEEPWFASAQAALIEEESGAEHSDDELAAIAMRELPLYFARFDDAAAAYVRVIGEDHVNGDALGLFNREIMNTFDLRPGLPQITSPTLVITGAADFITGPVCAAEIAAGIPGAKKVILPDAGHFIFIEAPDTFREAVRTFLSAGA